MPATRYPKRNVHEIVVENTMRGYTYNARGADGRIVYESPRYFRSAQAARAEIVSRWGQEMRIAYR